jgi:Flp pilus assembly protein TadG
MFFNAKSKRARKIGALGRFAAARKGTAAVEFALLAIPFFLLTAGVAEVAMIGLAQTSLDQAVSRTARAIRTGDVQAQGQTYQQVQESLCDEINSLLTVDCQQNLFLDVDTFNSFVTVNNQSPIVNGVLQQGQFGFNPGTSSSIVVVRAYYRWKILTPMFERIFQNVSGGERVLVSNLMFRNEPF